MKTRLTFLDNMKGIGIILPVMHNIIAFHILTSNHAAAKSPPLSSNIGIIEIINTIISFDNDKLSENHCATASAITNPPYYLFYPKSFYLLLFLLFFNVVLLFTGAFFFPPPLLGAGIVFILPLF